jgi:hypothetical protein
MQSLGRKMPQDHAAQRGGPATRRSARRNGCRGDYRAARSAGLPSGSPSSHHPLSVSASSASQAAPRIAAACVGAVLLAVYAATGARDLTFWDAGEFATAIAGFGIPHPPGTPLYVAIAVAVSQLLPWLTPVMVGTTVSAAATALACALAAALLARVMRSTWFGIAAGLCAGAMGTVWLNATETEVYAVSLCAIVVQGAAGWRAHRTDDDRARVLTAFLAALSLPLHLSALVGAPAAMLLANTDRHGAIRWRAVLASWLLLGATVMLSRAALLPTALTLIALVVVARWRDARDLRWLIPACAVTVLAWSAIAMLPVRAAFDPFLNQGAPDSLDRLLAVIARSQYDVSPLWPRRAPWWLQLGNLLQYADWQLALAAWNDVTPHWSRTPFTVVALLVAAIGARAHWRAERTTARVLFLLLLCATLGVAVQLNLRAGPSYGHGVLPADALHEARERDYFFAVAFWVWGLWLGVGGAALLRRLSASRPVFALITPLAIFGGNWVAVTRVGVQDTIVPRAIATELLTVVPRDALLLTAGDNDAYPVWYLQSAESVRRDVQVIVLPLLGAGWAAQQAAARGRFALDTAAVRDPLSRAAVLVRQQLDRGRPVVLSSVIGSATRERLMAASSAACAQRIGMVDLLRDRRQGAPCPARVDSAATHAAAQRLSSLDRPIRTAPDGMTAAFTELAACPRRITREWRARAASDRAPGLLDLTCNLR